MRQLATAAHQPSAFHVMPRVALSSKHHCVLPEKPFRFDKHTHTNSLSAPQHTDRHSFSLSPHLTQAISQSRSSLAYYIFTYIPSILKPRRMQHLIIMPRSCYRDQTRDLLVMSCSAVTRSPCHSGCLLSLIHSLFEHMHRLSDVSFAGLCLIHLWCTGNPSLLFSFSFQPLQNCLKSKSDTSELRVGVYRVCVCVWRRQTRTRKCMTGGKPRPLLIDLKKYNGRLQARFELSRYQESLQLGGGGGITTSSSFW